MLRIRFVVEVIVASNKTICKGNKEWITVSQPTVEVNN